MEQNEVLLIWKKHDVLLIQSKYKHQNVTFKISKWTCIDGHP